MNAAHSPRIPFARLLLSAAVALLAACGGGSDSGKCTQADLDRGVPCGVPGDSDGDQSVGTGFVPTDDNNVIPGGNNTNDGGAELPQDDGGRGPVPVDPGGGGGGGGGAAECAAKSPKWGDDVNDPPSPCNAASSDCLRNCGADINCASGCLQAADQTCQQCVVGNYYVCPDWNGCEAESGESKCCMEEKCGTAADEEARQQCAQAQCGTENGAYSACYQQPAVAQVCDDFSATFFEVCYSPSRGGGGGGGGGSGGACADPDPTWVASGGAASPCDATVSACIKVCGKDTNCANTCLSGASNECVECINQNFTVCPDWNGCETESGNFQCCAEEKCATAGDPQSCIQTNCAAEQSAYSACWMQSSVSDKCDDFGAPVFGECYTGGGGGGGGGGGATCAASPKPLPDGNTFCTASTKTCLASCAAGDFTCVNDCITSDTAAPVPTTSGGSVDCMYCLAYTEQYCAANGGCCSEYESYKQCVATNQCTTQACVKSKCGTPSAAFQSCVSSNTSCTDDYSKGVYNVCYP